MSEACFLAERSVSRETLARLAAFAALLEKWNPAINLISAGTVAQIWTRHFLDSAQVFDLADAKSGLWADLGSGGGFPGLVLAMAGCNPVHLVEANGKKAGFLRYVAAQTGTDVTIHACRIEDPALSGLAPVAAVTARACAALQQLLAWAAPLVDPDSRLVFLKGQSWREEIAAAERDWAFAWSATPSVTDPEAAIVTVTALEPRRPHALA